MSVPSRFINYVFIEQLPYFEIDTNLVGKNKELYL